MSDNFFVLFNGAQCRIEYRLGPTLIFVWYIFRYLKIQFVQLKCCCLKENSHWFLIGRCSMLNSFLARLHRLQSFTVFRFRQTDIFSSRLIATVYVWCRYSNLLNTCTDHRHDEAYYIYGTDIPHRCERTSFQLGSYDHPDRPDGMFHGYTYERQSIDKAA